MALHEVAAQAESRLELARSRGLISDWADAKTSRDFDFARLTVAVQRLFPPGGSIETGVFKGGTSGLLIQACAPGTFHVGVDPYGLPTQSYKIDQYYDWAMARQTERELAALADDWDVTYCHYYMDSRTFCRSDLLKHGCHFNVVHLDGDHSYRSVRDELSYFLSKLGAPVVYILDDHDNHFPGVERGLLRFRHRLEPLFHNLFDFPGYGIAGVSAWLDVGVSRDNASRSVARRVGDIRNQAHELVAHGGRKVRSLTTRPTDR